MLERKRTKSGVAIYRNYKFEHCDIFKPKILLIDILLEFIVLVNKYETIFILNLFQITDKNYCLMAKLSFVRIFRKVIEYI